MKYDYYKIISNNVKKYRKMRNITQEKLAEMVNCSTSFIGRIESKDAQKPSIDTLIAISEKLEVPLYLFFVNEKEDIEFIKSKSILFKCNKCNSEFKIQREIINLYKSAANLTGDNSIPHFDCTNCDGIIYPVNRLDI